MRENRLEEMHTEINRYLNGNKNSAYKRRNQIDLVFASQKVLRCIKGSKIIDYKEVIITYR